MARKDAPPSFQLYPRDILSSRAWILMTPEERGGYCSLLFHAWLSKRPGWLKDDERQLCVLSGLGAQRWGACRQAIARAWVVRRGWWIQRRMVQERRAQLRRYKSAQKGGRLRALQIKELVSTAIPLASSSASASAVKEESKEKEGQVSAAAIAHAKRLFPDRDVDLIEAKLLEYHSRRPYRSLQRALLSWCARAKKQGTEALIDRNGHIPVVAEQETPSERLRRWKKEGIL